MGIGKPKREVVVAYVPRRTTGRLKKVTAPQVQGAARKGNQWTTAKDK